MDILVAVDKNWGIGRKGQLLASLRTDQVRFRDLTIGQVVIYGRKTLESFPGEKPLPGRTNIIITHNRKFQVSGAVLCHNLADLPRLLTAYREQRIWVIGGDSIYRQLLPYCRRAFVTYIDREYPADKYFPELDLLSPWQQVEKSCWQEDVDRLAQSRQTVRFRYLLYEQEAKSILSMENIGT